MIYVLGSDTLSIQDFYSLVQSPKQLEWDTSARQRCNRSWELLMERVHNTQRVYGVNTGFGEEGRFVLDSLGVDRLQKELVAYHGCGTGPFLSEIESRAVLLARLITLAQGYSGVRPALVQQLIILYQAGLAPVIPSLGSVGASGDLTPLSYLAALVMGERRAWYKGQIWNTQDVFSLLGIKPLELQGREALAIMNGTAMMTSLAALSWNVIHNMLTLAQIFTGWGALSLDLEDEFLLDVPNSLKGHKGILTSAQSIRGSVDLKTTPVGLHQEGYNIQPRYSFRCAPQVLGLAVDTLEWTGQWLERELNGIDDNPIVDPESRRIYHNGNFSGYQVSFACDALRQVISVVVNLLDRQAQLLLDASQNRGLGPNLMDWDSRDPHFGLKAVGISLSAIAAEVQQMGTSVVNLSRPTESGNQDIVSMGSISARLLRKAEELSLLAIAHHAAIVTLALKRSKRFQRIKQKDLFDRLAAADPSKLDEQLNIYVKELSSFVHREGREQV